MAKKKYRKSTLGSKIISSLVIVLAICTVTATHSQTQPNTTGSTENEDSVINLPTLITNTLSGIIGGGVVAVIGYGFINNLIKNELDKRQEAAKKQNELIMNYLDDVLEIQCSIEDAFNELELLSNQAPNLHHNSDLIKMLNNFLVKFLEFNNKLNSSKFVVQTQENSSSENNNPYQKISHNFEQIKEDFCKVVLLVDYDPEKRKSDQKKAQINLCLTNIKEKKAQIRNFKEELGGNYLGAPQTIQPSSEITTK